jgi:hypothetical protein
MRTRNAGIQPTTTKLEPHDREACGFFFWQRPSLDWVQADPGLDSDDENLRP